MPSAPTLPPFDHEDLERVDVDSRPPSSPSADEHRWFGYRPRTFVIIAVAVALVLVAETQWLYSPFRSSSSTSTASVDPSVTDPGDPGDPSATDVSTTDPTVTGSFRTRSRVTIRTSPSSASVALGHVPEGTTVTVTCVAQGEAVTTSQGTDSRWDHVTVDTTTGYITNALAVPSPGGIPADQLAPC